MNKKDNSNKKNSRNLAREYALQALYQWQLSQAEVGALILAFEQDHDFSNVDKAYWHELVVSNLENRDELELKMQPFLTRSIKSITPVELSILRISFYELCNRPDVPYRVVINEAINLIKIFGASDSHRFVNGVLDSAAKVLRAAEVEMHRNKKDA